MLSIILEGRISPDSKLYLTFGDVEVVVPDFRSEGKLETYEKDRKQNYKAREGKHETADNISVERTKAGKHVEHVCYMNLKALRSWERKNLLIGMDGRRGHGKKHEYYG